MSSSVALPLMPVVPLLWLWLVMIAVVITMVALELLSPHGPRWRYGTAKMAGSAVFVVAAAFTHPPAAIMIGLVCCALGDLLLIPKGAKRLFGAGLAAFLSGHLAFAYGFAPPPRPSMMMLLVPVVIVGVVMHQWLLPHVSRSMKAPVTAYIVAILLMAWMAVAAVAQQVLSPAIATAAVMFCASDVFVARERFVSSGSLNRVAGIPLYFFAQLFLATGW